MGVRVDKFVWGVRLAKSRSLAVEAIRGGKILVNGVGIKPSREIVVGDVIGFKRMPVVYSFRVLALLERRVGAKLVCDYLEDITSEAELEKGVMARYSSSGIRERGAGRPTKRDRRELEDFFDTSDD